LTDQEAVNRVIVVKWEILNSSNFFKRRDGLKDSLFIKVFFEFRVKRRRNFQLSQADRYDHFPN